MTQINWGMLPNNSFQNALSMGIQMGQEARARQDQKEQRNALAAFVTNPTPETEAAVAPYAPNLVLQGRQQRMAAEQQQLEGSLVQAAIGGDDAALTQLATVNFDKWKTLNREQKAAAKQEAELFGNAAMDLLNTPPEARGPKLQAYAGQFGQQYPEIAQIVNLPPDQLEMALRTAVAEASMTQKLIEMERPNYQAVPFDSTLVNVRDPQAVAAFGSASQYQDGATATNPQTGEKIIFRNGQWQPMGGPAGNGGDSFRSGVSGFRGLSGERITSTFRDPQKNASVGGVPNSYHMRRFADGTAMARDSVPPPGMSMEAYAAELRRLNPDMEVINEGDHVHMEPK